MTDDKTDMTEAKTMWSESLLESLYVALKKSKDDGIVRDIINDLRAKDYEDDYILNKVKKKIGPNAAVRVEAILKGKKSSPVKSGTRRTSGKSGDSGLVGKIKGMFGGK